MTGRNFLHGSPHRQLLAAATRPRDDTGMDKLASPPRPHLTEPAERARQERLERQAAALRANLRRRKAQTSERQTAAPLPAEPRPTDED